MVKDIICTFAFNQSLGSIREAARVLGVDMKIIKKGVERCMILDSSQNAFWMDYKKAKRFYALFEYSKQLVVDWWRIETSFQTIRTLQC